MTDGGLRNLPGFVLAGGRSERLGQDKARAFLCEEFTLIEAVIASVKEACASWTVVADKPDKFADLGLKTIVDDELHRGPLGGIGRAARQVGDGYFFLMSCDRIGLRKEWVQRLKEALRWALREKRSAPAAAFCERGRWEPLLGIYHGSLAAQIEARLERKEAAVWRFLDEIKAVEVEAPQGWEKTFSVNRPEDLERARKIWSPS